MIIFILFYVLLWGIVPSLFFKSVYPDTAENLTLAHTLLWSYSKHPPLGMWVIFVFKTVFASNEVAGYLAGASCLLLSVLRLGRQRAAAAAAAAAAACRHPVTLRWKERRMTLLTLRT